LGRCDSGLVKARLGARAEVRRYDAAGSTRVCVDLVKGFIRVHWRGFRGDDPG
jgi:hypothetical protein